MKEIIRQNNSSCIPTYISTCEKDFYRVKRMEKKTEVNSLERPFEHYLINENTFGIREINIEDILIQQTEKQEITGLQKEFLSGTLEPSDFLDIIESHIPEELISTKYFKEIKNFANNFSGNLTSFFGFESRLSEYDEKSDYLFAISAKKGEREALINFIESKNFSIYRNDPKWQQISKFAYAWVNQSSKLYKEVLGLWFEFDSSDFSSLIPVPNIFLQTIPIRIDNQEDLENCKWITQEAFTLLTGKNLPKKIEKNIFQCIQKLPKGATCIHFGVMLSRPIEGVRLVFNRIPVNQIIKYLKSIGWSENTKELSSLIRELKKYVTRIVLHINVGERIDPKIGLECSFYPDKYHLESGWEEFFDYLTKKGLCIPEKKSAILKYSGIEQDINEDFDINSYMVVTKIQDTIYSHALVRYISHVKIIFTPNHPLEAKVYPGVRLFGRSQKSFY